MYYCCAETLQPTSQLADLLNQSPLSLAQHFSLAEISMLNISKFYFTKKLLFPFTLLLYQLISTGVTNRNQDPVKTFYDYYKIRLHHNAAAN